MGNTFKERRSTILAKKLILKGKLEDSVVVGLLGGLAGSVCMEIANYIIYRSKKTEGLYGHIAGQFFVPPVRTKQRKNFVLGELLHLATGSVFGLLTMLLMKKTGKDHYLSKGLTISMLTWGLLYSGGQKLGVFKRFHLTKTHYSAVINNIIYGLISSVTMVFLANPKVFPSASKKKKEVEVNTDQNFESREGLYSYSPENLTAEQHQYLH